MKVRLPRVVLACLVGGALGCAGASTQGMFQNPLADPFLIGVSAGASAGVAVAIFGANLSAVPLPFYAFLGALISVLIVYRLSKVGGSTRADTLILAGIALGAFLTALTSALIYLAGHQFQFLIYWMMGGLYTATWQVIVLAAIPIVLGLVGLIIYSKQINLLALGDEEALHLGVDVEQTRLILFILVALVCGGAVSVSGIIGFVGLIVPHIMRVFVGSNHRVLLPASAIGGAMMLMWADALARTALAPIELPVGILTALCGGPFFIYLLRRKMRRS